MQVEITGTVAEISKVESFGKNNYQKRTVVIEKKGGQYTDKYAVEFGGDSVTIPNKSQVGDLVKVKAFIRSNEYQGRYFTNLNGVNIEVASSDMPKASVAPKKQGTDNSAFEEPATKVPLNSSFNDEEDLELPF